MKTLLTTLLLFPLLTYSQRFILCDEPVDIQLSIQGEGNDFHWTISDGLIFEAGREAWARVTHFGKYDVTASFELGGCVYETNGSFYIDTCLKWTIWIPNALVPDGSNRTWFPIGENIRIDNIDIYDRWGHIAWSGNVPFEGLNFEHNMLDGQFTYIVYFTELVYNTRQEKKGVLYVVH